MGLLSKIKESLCGKDKPVEDEVKYVRKDLFIFATADFELRDDKDYCFVGYYNNDKTKVKDVLTGKIYNDCGWYDVKSEDGSKKFCVEYCSDWGNNHYFKDASSFNPETVLKGIMFAKKEWNTNMRDYCLVSVGGHSAGQFFLKMRKNDMVSESLVRDLVNDLNKRAHQKIVEIKATEQAVDNARKGYDTNF